MLRSIDSPLLRFDSRSIHYQVYAGSVSPSISLAEWESMGLEDRMSAILSASRTETVVEDVRAFARATTAAGGDCGRGGVRADG